MTITRAVESLAKDYADFKARTQRRLDIMSTWQATTGSGGGGTTDHPRLHNINSELDHTFPLEWARLSKTGSNLNEIQTRNYIDLQNRTHSVIGADHSLAAPKYSLVGATENNVLGVLLARGNAQAAGNYDTILRADGSGGLSLVYLNALTHVDTPEITSPLHLALTPTNGGKIHATATMSHPGWVSREFGVAIDFTEGWIDAQAIQAQRAHFRTAIIDVTRAYAGDLSVTKSVSTIAEDESFTVPATGGSATLVLDDLPGLDGIQLADDNDYAKVYFYSREFFPSAHPQYVQSLSINFNVTASTLQENSFESTSIGNMPSGWWESGGGNGTSEITPTRMSVQLDPTDAGNQAFDKTGSVTNAHTHLRSNAGIQNETTGYVVTGRFYLKTDGGIGFTVLSKYSDTGTSIDEYVRVRRTYTGDPFEVANHGSYPSPDAGYGTGTADGTTIPVVSTWYQFKIDVDVQGTYTYVKFKFWEDGQAEPSAWELDVRFSGANRPTQGTAGLWLFGGDYQVDDYRIAERTASYSASIGLGGESVRQGDYLMAYLVATEDPYTFASITNFPVVAEYSGAIIANRVRHIRGFADADASLGCTVVLSSATEQTGTLLVHHFRNVDTSGSVVVSTYGGASPYSFTGTGYDEDKYSEVIAYLDFDNAGGVTSEPTVDTDMSQMVRETQIASATWGASLYHAQILTADGASQFSGTLGFSGTINTNTLIQRFEFTGLGTAGPLNVGRIWGQIVADDVTVTPDGTQAYTWTTREVGYSGGDVIEEGQTVLIYGQGNVVPTLSDGYIELTTRDAAAVAPYLRMALLPTNPATMPPYVYFQAGAINNLGWTSSKFGVVITKPYSSSTDFPDAGDTFTPSQYIEISDTKVLMRGIPLHMFNAAGVWKVDISDSGLMRLGLNLSAANNAQTGFYFDPVTGNLQVGRSGYPGNVTVVGSITITNPNEVASDLVGGGLQDELIASGWGFLDSTPNSPGLYLTSTYLGFYNGSAWGTYINNNGHFSFGVNQRIYFDGNELYGKNSSNVKQWSVSASTGVLYAGGNDVRLDSQGVTIEAIAGGFNPTNRLAFEYGTSERGYLAGSKEQLTNDFRMVIGAIGTGSGAWGTISLRPYIFGQAAFGTGNIGNHSLDITPGGTLVSGRGMQVIDYSGITNTPDPASESVDQGRIRFVSGNGTRVYVELYVNDSGQLIYRKSSGATGVLV